MESAPTTQNSKIPHIDARTIDEIAMDNKRLMDQLKYNHMCMNLRKKENLDQKIKTNIEKIIQKPRKTFAFRINIDKMTLDQQQIAFDTINSLIKIKDAKITKSFTLNNYIYIRINHNLTINQEKINLPTGHIMEQINPKDIININLK